MKAHQEQYPVAVMGRLLDVSRSGFYSPWSSGEQGRELLKMPNWGRKLPRSTVKAAGTMGAREFILRCKREEIDVESTEWLES